VMVEISGKAEATRGGPVDFTFTPAAARKLQGYMAEKGSNVALRIQIRRSITGTEWAMTLEPRTGEAVTVGGVPVLVDPKTASQLEGLVIDWVQTPKGPGFGVYNRNLQDYPAK